MCPCSWLQNVVHNLKIRYQKNEIYTSVSKILVAINPYQRLNIYGPEARLLCCVFWMTIVVRLGTINVIFVVTRWVPCAVGAEVSKDFSLCKISASTPRVRCVRERVQQHASNSNQSGELQLMVFNNVDFHCPHTTRAGCVTLPLLR